MTRIDIRDFPGPTFVADARGIIQDCNELFAELLGRPVVELRGTSHADLAADPGQPQWSLAPGDPPVTRRHEYRAPDDAATIIVNLALRARHGEAGESEIIGTVTALPDTSVQLAATLDGVRHNLAVLAPDGTIGFINQFVLDQFGMTREQGIGMKLYDGPWISSNEVRGILIRNLELAATGTAESVVVPVDTPDGLQYHEATLTPVFDDAGDVVQIIAWGADVTERVVAEQALRESERTLRNLQATSELAQSVAQVGVFCRELPDGESHWSDEIFRIFGLDRQTHTPSFELLRSIVHPDDLPNIEAELERLMADPAGDPREVEHRIKRPDGDVRHVVSFIGIDRTSGPVQIVGATMDVTERHARDRVVREQAHLLDLIFRHSVDCLALMDKDYNFIRVSESYAATAGERPADDYPGRNHFDLFPSSAEQEFKEAIAAGRIYQRFARPFVYPDQPERGTTWWDIALVPIRDNAGEVELLLMTLKDVTGHVRAERRLQAVLDTTTDGILEMDVGSGVVQVSRRIVDLLQLDPAAAEQGIAYDDLLAMVDGAEAFDRTFRECVESRGSGREEHDLIRGDGSRIRVEGTFQVLSPELADDPTLRVIGALRDVTAHRLLENRLQQLQKLEAIGQFAGGVAHDFNNLLSVVLATVEVVREALGTPDPDLDQILRDLDGVNDAANRGTRMVRKLLAFGRKQTVQLAPIDPGRCVLDLEPLLRRLIREDVLLAVDTGAETLWPVLGDTAVFEQVMMNLVTNARNAMPSGGRLDVRLANREVNGQSAAPLGIPPGHYVELSVADTGGGMAPDVLERIFEPFYTTNRTEDGHGLGLSTVHGLVQLCGGQIQVDSQPGVGSTFRLFFPRATGSASETEAPSPVAHPAGPDGPCRILLCEDSDDLRRLIATGLRSAGYEVLEAEHGLRGVEIADTHPGPIHLLVTDGVMPHLNGREVAARVREKYPDLPVILISGYAHGVLEPGESSEFDLLPKPLTPSRVRLRIEEVLGRTTRRRP